MSCVVCLQVAHFDFRTASHGDEGPGGGASYFGRRFGALSVFTVFPWLQRAFCGAFLSVFGAMGENLSGESSPTHKQTQDLRNAAMDLGSLRACVRIAPPFPLPVLAPLYAHKECTRAAYIIESALPLHRCAPAHAALTRHAILRPRVPHARPLACRECAVSPGTCSALCSCYGSADKLVAAPAHPFPSTTPCKRRKQPAVCARSCSRRRASCPGTHATDAT